MTMSILEMSNVSERFPNLYIFSLDMLWHYFTGTHWFLSSYWSSCQVFEHLHLRIGQKTKPSLFLNSHICHYCLLLWLTHWHRHILHVGEVHDDAGAVLHGSVHVCSCCGCKIKMIQLVIKQIRKKKERGQISGTCLIGFCSQLLKRDTTKICMPYLKRRWNSQEWWLVL